MPISSGFDHLTTITLFVEDLHVSGDFYARAFGLAPVFEDPESVVFRFGELLINLLLVSAAPELIEPASVAPPRSGVRSVMTVKVDDVDERCKELTARGIELLNGPIDRPWGPRTASFVDPSGHVWELAQ